MMAGTEIMTIADLDRMEARVDIGEIDVVLIALGQKARLEVEAFRDRKFTGVVTEIANAAKGAASNAQQSMGSSQQQEATKFEVKILIQEKEPFRPGMSVTAEIETRSRTNVLAVPIMAVTTRTTKGAEKEEKKEEPDNSALPLREGKKEAAPKADEIVFLVNGDAAKLAKVKTGISDDSHIEVVEGLTEGQEIVAGGYAAVSRLLEDGKKIKKEEQKASAKKAGPEA
jgi:HlyD family secretion protein